MEYYVRASKLIDEVLSACVKAYSGSIGERIPFGGEVSGYLYSISFPERQEDKPLDQAFIEGIQSLEHVIDVEPAGGIARALDTRAD